MKTFVFFALFLVSCGAMSPRTKARSAVLLVSEAVSAADQACALAGLEREDKVLLQKCVEAYKAARLGLVGAAESIDAWDEAKEKSLPCALAPVLAAIARLAEDLRAAKVEVPPEIVDALEGADALVGRCAS